MKLKKGQFVEIPKGTPISFFSGSLLDKDSIKKSIIEYRAVGKISEINQSNICIDPWHNGGSGYAGCLNIPIQFKDKLEPTNLICIWDDKLSKQCVFNPDSFPHEGSREYDISVSFETKDRGETISKTIWAKDRKNALKFARFWAKNEWGHEGIRHQAKLVYKNQKPFSKKDLISSLPHLY